MDCFWTAGLLDRWNAGQLDWWTAGLLDCWNAGLLDWWTAGLDYDAEDDYDADYEDMMLVMKPMTILSGIVNIINSIIVLTTRTVLICCFSIL